MFLMVVQYQILVALDPHLLNEIPHEFVLESLNLIFLMMSQVKS
jgi:hypothetical protein